MHSDTYVWDGRARRTANKTAPVQAGEPAVAHRLQPTGRDERADLARLASLALGVTSLSSPTPPPPTTT